MTFQTRGLFLDRSFIEGGITAVMERPHEFLPEKVKQATPIAVADIELPDTAAYEALCAELDISPQAIVGNRVVRAFQSKRIPRYDAAEVSAYMTSITPAGLHWGWQRLGKSGSVESPYQNQEYFIDQRGVAHTSAIFRVDSGMFANYDGVTIGGEYKKLVPMHILKRMKAVKEMFADENPRFFVTDYAVPDPDPFIKVCLDCGEEVIFGVWDEPGFGDLKTEV